MPMVRKTSEQIRKARLTPPQRRRLDAMTDSEITAAARSDRDNMPLKKGELAHLRRGGRPPLPADERRQSLTLRLPPVVIRDFKALGPGWQTRIGEVLQQYVRRSAKGVVVRSSKGAKKTTPRRAAPRTMKGR